MNEYMIPPKAPIKFELVISGKRKDSLYGRVRFHDEEYKITINKSEKTEKIKIPFIILGIMNECHLVRISGQAGAYTEYRPKIENSVKNIQIESNTVFNDIESAKEKYDSIEIFVN